MGHDKYKSLFERSADAILIIRDGRFVDCNPTAVKMLRYENKSGLLDTHPSELSPEYQPDGRLSYEKADDMINTAFEKGNHRFEWMHKRADGEVFPVEVLLTAVEEDAQKTLHVVWRDITERKQRETDLLRLESIIESTSDIIVSATPDAHVFYLNTAAQKTLGRTGMTNPVRISELHPDWALAIIENKGIPYAVENGIWEGETAAITAKGEEIPVSQVIMSHKSLDGKLRYLSTIMRDMSDHYRNRAERLELQNRLHQAQKMEAIGTLAGGIAHDFNNILSGIFGYLQLAANHIEEPEKLAKYIREVQNGSQKAAELIQQILTFSRKSAHRMNASRLYLIVHDALKLMRATLPSTIVIKEHLNTRAKVMADATKMHQVMMNICTNAYHAMRDTGGTLSIHLDEIDITPDHFNGNVRLKTGRYLKLVISDTGPGIPKEMQTKVFEPYFTTKTADKGTGLGLAVVHGIIEEHNGTISLESIEGQGSSFIIHLPVVQKDVENTEAFEKEYHLTRGQETILLVDDESSILDSTSLLLRYQGYKVKTFSNGKEALGYFLENPGAADLLVSDITMPQMTGDQLAVNVLAERPGMPIILCSGYNENISEQDMMKIGIQKFLKKPIHIKELLFHIQQVLARVIN